ncbi:GNAT family N-acetyltransferase [Salinicola avicenniae]|uniref:GNAT family N-acetyltransferase n=1 Tax=Salinicola avicenniae TaxID=2916836 RepID=UPI00207395FA|nr:MULTISPECIES: GNAT family N-acetyltransferase [unclassified Salinicola]
MITLRLATAADRPRVEALVNAAYGHYVERIGTVPGPMRDDYAAYIAAGYVTLLLDDEAIGGLLVLIPHDDTLLLDNVAVAPGHQGRGIGRRLMQLAEQRARELGLGSITLYTQEQMHENRAIYRHYGYVETHHARERGLDRVYLRKMLT